MPYITHTIAVTLIVGDYTEDEDVLIAALLHDTLEDTDYTASELQEDFGGKVRDLVESLTSKEAEGASWLTQKKHYAKLIKKAPEGALIVAAADMIHNMRAVVEEYIEDHSRFIQEFGGSLDDRLMMYQDISNVLNSRLKNDIIHEFNHVNEEYKNFILDVKKTKEAREEL